MRAGSTRGRGTSIWANTHNNRKLDDACCGGTGASCDVHVCGFYVRIRFSRFFMLFVRFFLRKSKFRCKDASPETRLAASSRSRPSRARVLPRLVPRAPEVRKPSHHSLAPPHEQEAEIRIRSWQFQPIFLIA